MQGGPAERGIERRGGVGGEIPARSGGFDTIENNIKKGKKKRVKRL